MGINRQKVKKQFKKYTDKYNPQDEKIALKIKHTYKVAEISDRISRSLGLSEADQDLAWAIGMLHDIGRFEQVKRYGTFMDSQSVDHAQFGADLLFDEGIISRFGIEYMTEEEVYLIELAIRQHNKYRVMEGLSDREMMFCNIIRDADKVDIFRVNIESTMEAIYGVSTEEIKTSKVTPQVMEYFDRNVCVDRNVRRSAVDNLVGHISLFFELVYRRSQEVAVEQGYLAQMLEFQSNDEETKADFDHIRQVMNQYISDHNLQ